MDIYLVNCSGMGDTYFSVVDKETFDWIESPRPEMEDCSAREQVPPTLAKVLAKEDIPTELLVTSGSCENDRALYCRSTIEGYKDVYFSLVDVIKDMDSDHELVDTWEGAIY